jgi:hypothetical protein
VAANGDSVLRAEQPAARPRTRPELRLTTDTTVFPPRLFSFPTGEILPSLAAHASSGWTFGFSDEKRASRWALSAGLGGIGEITLTSATITHIADPESDALAGFRIKIPTTWLGDKAGEQLFVALNLAATGQNSFSSGNFIATDGAAVEYLTYRYHETTLGTAVTWKHDKVRLHGLLHVTDFRADHLTYRADHVNQGGGEQKLVYPNFGAGVEYEANPKTHLLWEIRTIPEVMFSGPSSDRLRITNQWQTTAGLRFFPAPLLGMDAFVGVDEDAKGLADLDIGFGLHFVVAPSLTPAR